MSINSVYGSSGLSLDLLNRTVFQGLRTQESRLHSTLSTIGSANGNVTQTELLRMQQEVQQWNMFVDIQSTITKQIADSIKSVIQKSA